MALLAALNALPARPAAFDEHAPQIAEALAQATRGTRDAATLFAVGYFESGFQPRIQEGLCKPNECDRGRARSFWQLHDWVRGWSDMIGMDRVGVAADVAARILRRGRRVCHSEAGAISFFAVGTCFGWKGADQRAAFSLKIEQKLASCGHRRDDASNPPMK
jgi:hypothetical protein